jgi:hypothetical protein
MNCVLIVDSVTRKNGMLVLKEKSDASRVLEEWKKAVGLEANTKIKAARSDNIPEPFKQSKDGELLREQKLGLS